MLKRLTHVAQGFGMGIANVIPGVSGGTMALIFGIFERLVAAMRDGVSVAVDLARWQPASAWTRAKALPWGFILPLGVGLLAAPFSTAGLMKSLLADHPQIMRGLFFGLIVGSLPVPWMRTRERNAVGILLLVLAAAGAYLLAGLPPRAVADPSDLQIAWTAALAITAMILPGISGSYVLLVLGMYDPILGALDSFDVQYLVVFAVGAGLGLAAFTVVLNWLLEHRHDLTMLVLVGLMAGSLRALWPWQTDNVPRLAEAGEPVLPVLAVLVLGLALTGLLTWIDRRRIGAADDGKVRPGASA